MCRGVRKILSRRICHCAYSYQICAPTQPGRTLHISSNSFWALQISKCDMHMHRSVQSGLSLCSLQMLYVDFGICRAIYITMISGRKMSFKPLQTNSNSIFMLFMGLKYLQTVYIFDGPTITKRFFSLINLSEKYIRQGTMYFLVISLIRFCDITNSRF